MNGFLIELDNSIQPSKTVYGDTPLDFSASASFSEALPERLREMKRLYEYGSESYEAKAKNFYRQGKFMEDYEDDASWAGDFTCYFPSYHDLTTKQLRGYFSWRTRVRRGEYHPIAASAAYIYIYELLNGIGASSPEESLEKLKLFDAGYFGHGYGDERMRQNLRRWMTEFSILHDLSPESVLLYIDPDLIRNDTALAVLQHPEGFSDEEVFSAFCRFGKGKFSQSPVLTKEPERGMHLFCDAWRIALRSFRHGEKDLFTLCFGKKTRRPWHPLANAVVFRTDEQQDREYKLNEGRIYRCRGGVWEVECFEKLLFDRERFNGFLRETDLCLRRYLKTGRLLRVQETDCWADPYIQEAIEADRRAVIRNARPKVTIDLAGLDKIRSDAAKTRDSLLTEEECEEPHLFAEVPENLSLDMTQVRILRTLLAGEPADAIIKENRLLPSVVADALNEALFDEFGDSVISCNKDTLSIEEDYRDELEQLLGGPNP